MLYKLNINTIMRSISMYVNEEEYGGRADIFGGIAGVEMDYRGTNPSR